MHIELRINCDEWKVGTCGAEWREWEEIAQHMRLQDTLRVDLPPIQTHDGALLCDWYQINWILLSVNTSIHKMRKRALCCSKKTVLFCFRCVCDYTKTLKRLKWCGEMLKKKGRPRCDMVTERRRSTKVWWPTTKCLHWWSHTLALSC